MQPDMQAAENLNLLLRSCFTVSPQDLKHLQQHFFQSAVTAEGSRNRFSLMWFNVWSGYEHVCLCVCWTAADGQTVIAVTGERNRNSEKLLYLNYETCLGDNMLNTCIIVRHRHTQENEKTKWLQLSVPRDFASERCCRVATGKQRNCQKDVSSLDTEPPQAAKTSKPVLVQDWRISVTRCDTAELLQIYLNAAQTAKSSEFNVRSASFCFCHSSCIVVSCRVLPCKKRADAGGADTAV